MCLILLAWRAHPEFPLVFAGNRDEAYDRPSAAARFWERDPDIYGGRDLQHGGTWLGLRRDGRLAAVTNYREGPARRPAPRSRGALTVDFLRGSAPPDAYLATVIPDAGLYGGFTLLVGDRERLYAYSNRGVGIQEVVPGVHGLSNHLLDTAWPKIVTGKRRVAALLGAREPDLKSGLLAALADRTPASEPELPDTGVGPDRERELSPAFIAGTRYGTRASTVVLVSRGGDVLFVERRFGPGGEPIGENERRFTLQGDMRASGRVTKAAGQDV